MDLLQSNTLPKRERLSCRKDIQALLSKGRFSTSGAIRFCVLKGNGLDYNRIMVSVPKRNFKRAVKRNLLKRRIREAYRLQKSLLPEGGIDMMFAYVSREIHSQDSISADVRNILCIVSEKK